MQADNNLMTAASNLALIEIMDGNDDRFGILLKRRLAESGWCHQVKLMCMEVSKEFVKNGQTVTLEDLIANVSAKARAIIPTAIKQELLMEMKHYFLLKGGYYDGLDGAIQSNLML